MNRAFSIHYLPVNSKNNASYYFFSLNTIAIKLPINQRSAIIAVRDYFSQSNFRLNVSLIEGHS